MQMQMQMQATNSTTVTATNIEINPVFNFILNTLDVCTFTGSIFGCIMVLIGYDIMYITIPISLPLISIFIGLTKKTHKIEINDGVMMKLEKQEEMLNKINLNINEVPNKLEESIEFKLEKLKYKVDLMEARSIENSERNEKIINVLRKFPDNVKNLLELQEKAILTSVEEEMEKSNKKMKYEINKKLENLEKAIYSYSKESEFKSETDNIYFKKEEDYIREDNEELMRILQRLEENQEEINRNIENTMLNNEKNEDIKYIYTLLTNIESNLKTLPEQIEQENDGIEDKLRNISDKLDLLQSEIKEINKLETRVFEVLPTREIFDNKEENEETYLEFPQQNENLKEAIIPITASEPELEPVVTTEPVINFDEIYNEALNNLKKGKNKFNKDYGECYKLLMSALDKFENLMELDDTNTKVLGNCGNTLLTLGELKLKMSNSVLKQNTTTTEKQMSEQLKDEARQFLASAGRQFSALLKIDENDKKAYMNWGRALFVRGQISLQSQYELFEAALAKFKQIKIMDNDNYMSNYNMAKCLKEIALILPDQFQMRLKEAIILLEEGEKLAKSDSFVNELISLKNECLKLLTTNKLEILN